MKDSTPPKPLETKYGGCRFRSRLEARWAVFFDALSIAWDYEPEGYDLGDAGYYLPDFWLPQVEMFAEVKPGKDRDKVVITHDEMAKVIALAMSTGHAVVILDGPPRDTNYWGVETQGWVKTVVPRVEWMYVDYVLSDPNQYHITESRFYASSGGADLVHDWPSEDPSHPAVVAARSARFGT